MAFSANNKRACVLHCIPALASGGTERMLLQTIQRMKGYRHIVCCLLHEGSIADQLRSGGVLVINLHLRFPFLRSILAFRHLVQEKRPIILITYLPLADFFGKIFGRLFKIPIILCSLRSTLRDRRYVPLILLETLTHTLTTHYIAVSNAVKERYVRFGVPHHKITVIANGIDLKRFNTNNRTLMREEFRAMHSIESTDCVIVLIGNLRKERGHNYILKAFAEAQPSLQYHSSLWIIGDGPERKNLEQLTAHLRINQMVKFFGFCNNLPEILNAADIAISSSLYEGMSNALLEVMASGLAIIAVDVPENRELISNESSGLMTPPRSITKLTHAITRMVNSPHLRTQLASTAHNTAQKFSIDQTAQNLDKVFQLFISRFM